MSGKSFLIKRVESIPLLRGVRGVLINFTTIAFAKLAFQGFSLTAKMPEQNLFRHF
jgi:hypothetical protein